MTTDSKAGAEAGGDDAPATTASFVESLLGRSFLASGPARRFLAWPLSRRVVVTVAALAALLFIPYVGAVGLGDPWETHYGEVGREMLARNDFVFPTWESAPFYSKPPLTMWIDAIGMAIVGTNRSAGKVSIYTEWGMRLPMALLVIASLCLFAFALTRTAGRKVGLTAAFVLATMPLYFILARQVITDTPFEACFIGSMACAMIGLFDAKTKHRSAWWYGFYVLMGLSTLGKEFVGVLIGGLALIFYACLCVVPWEAKSLADHARWVASAGYRREVREGHAPMPTLWAEMFRMRFGTGLLVFLAVAAPWLLSMIFFAKDREAENETFVYRYFIHDQIARLTAGVHTTERNATFTYFLEQGGYAMFTWVSLLPGAIALSLRFNLRALDAKTRVGLLAALWALCGFGIVAASATKFPHYIFPALPAVAILIAYFIEQLWEDGVAKHGLSLAAGLVLFGLVCRDIATGPSRDGRDYMGVPTFSGGLKNFTDLYIYNHERPYPEFLISRPVTLFGGRPLTTGDFLAMVLIAVGAYLFFETFGQKLRAELSGRVIGLLLVALGAVPLLVSGGVQASALALAAGAFHLAWVYALVLAARQPADLRASLKATAIGLGVVALVLTGVAFTTPIASDPILRNLGETKDLRTALGYGFWFVGALLFLAVVMRARFMLFTTYGAFVIAFALWFSWSHWVNYSHHWSQRDLFWRYYDKRKPDEPIAAYLMDWKGETFYSRNTVKQIKTPEKLTEYLALPGRKWMLVEQGFRFTGDHRDSFSHVVGTRPWQAYDRELNAKFVLVSVD